MPVPKVLLVADDPAVREAVSLLLDLEGVASVSARGAADALGSAARDAPAAVLVDVGASGGEGVALCRALRAGGVIAPILLLSAGPGRPPTGRSLEAGADEVLPKPFDNARLVAALRDWVSRAPEPAGDL